MEPASTSDPNLGLFSSIPAKPPQGGQGHGGKNVLLFTGHMFDGAGRAEPRFPINLSDEARRLIRIYLDEEIRLQPPGLAVCSLAAGGDMIFADEVLKKQIPLVIVLPFDKEQFITGSVTYPKQVTGGESDDPEVLRNEFERISSLAAEIRYAGEHHAGDNPYARCNTAIVEYAMNQAGEDVNNITAFTLLNPNEKPIQGGTAHFVEELKARDIPLQVIWPAGDGTQTEDVTRLHRLVPVFRHLDSSASHHQNRWKKRLKIGIGILAMIAFFDAFVTSPDHFFWGYGGLVRTIALLISMTGVFITLHMQISDKTSLSQWTQNRARAEQIRSEIWFYLFNLWSQNNRSGTYGEGEFEAYTKQMKPWSWHGHLINLKKLTGLKQNVLQMSVPDKIDLYNRFRLHDQLSYFKSKNAYFSRRLKLYKSATYVFLIISVAWGVLKLLAEFIALPSLFMDLSPLGMMISFIALVSTYAESNNSKEMEFKYQQMAEGIEVLNKKVPRIKSHSDFETFVKECETFLRTQNNEWSLKRLNQ